MPKSELQTRIADLEHQIAEFPSGSITKKMISGRIYFYRRWTEDKKRKEKYIPMEEVETVRLQIEHRKRLEQELKELKKQLPKLRQEKKVSVQQTFLTNVRTGKLLRSFSAPVRGRRKR